MVCRSVRRGPQRAERHLSRDRSTDGAMLLERGRIDVDMGFLHLIRVGHPPADERCGRPGNLRQHRCEHSASAGLDDCERFAAALADVLGARRSIYRGEG